MNRQVAKYSIIRFQPFTETEEFANVGVVLYSPTSQKLSFKLRSAKESGRICQFFDPLDKQIYTHSLKIIRDELERIQAYSQEVEKAKGEYIYTELIRQREGIIQYSPSRVLLTENIKNTIDDLFQRYVHRSFTRREGFEEKMKKRIKTLLRDSSLLSKNFVLDAEIGNEEIYKVTFPFVNQQENLAIKPIHFKHNQPKLLIEHGLTWLTKIQQLKRHDFIQPNRVLFAFQPPEQEKDILLNAFQDIKEQIEESGIIMRDINDTEQIMHFVQQTKK